mmetsp:Transcript_6005/g.24354  ORF Transcript_6005/g.24354 Transcript_6005/m.24354 type:complete len:247 (-) Transcript_6005:64-804(-)
MSSPSCLAVSQTCTTPASDHVATMDERCGMHRTRFTAPWCAIFRTRSSGPSPGRAPPSSSLLSLSLASLSSGSPAGSFSLRRVFFRRVRRMTASAFCSAETACVPATMNMLCGKCVRSSPSSSRTTSKERHGHSSDHACKQSYTVGSYSSSSSSSMPSTPGRHTSGRRGAPSSILSGSSSPSSIMSSSSDSPVMVVMPSSHSSSESFFEAPPPPPPLDFFLGLRPMVPAERFLGHAGLEVPSRRKG